MSSQHRDPNMAVRVPKSLRDDAKATLNEHHWGIREFVIACLTAVASSPKDFLSRLEIHRPAPNPNGRPRKESDADEDDDTDPPSG